MLTRPSMRPRLGNTCFGQSLEDEAVASYRPTDSESAATDPRFRSAVGRGAGGEACPGGQSPTWVALRGRPVPRTITEGIPLLGGCGRHRAPRGPGGLGDDLVAAVAVGPGSASDGQGVGVGSAATERPVDRCPRNRTAPRRSAVSAQGSNGHNVRKPGRGRSTERPMWCSSISGNPASTRRMELQGALITQGLQIGILASQRAFHETQDLAEHLLTYNESQVRVVASAESQQKERAKFPEPVRGHRVALDLGSSSIRSRCLRSSEFGRDGPSSDKESRRPAHQRRSGVRIPSAPPM